MEVGDQTLSLGMEAAMGTQQTVRTEHPVELVWGRGCSPGLEPPFKSAPTPSVLLSRVKPESDLSYRPFQISSDLCTDWTLVCTISYNNNGALATVCVAACVLGRLYSADMQSFEEVYDHLVGVRTGPERLASFSRSHSCVEEKQEFDLIFCPCTIHHPSIVSGGG